MKLGSRSFAGVEWLGKKHIFFSRPGRRKILADGHPDLTKRRAFEMEPTWMKVDHRDGERDPVLMSLIL